MKKKELKQIIADLQAALAAAQQVKETKLVSVWLDVHEQAIRDHGFAASTVSNRVSVLKHIRRIWGDVKLGDLRPMSIVDGLKEFLPGKSSTAQRVLAELRDTLSSAVVNGWVDVNAAAHVKMPKHKVLRKRLTLETWERMYAYAECMPPWVRPMLALALVTGQRRGDLATMRFDDVHAGHLHVIQQKKAGKEFGAHVAIPVDLRLDAVGITLRDVIEACGALAAPGEFLLRKSTGAPLEASSLSIRFSECLHAVCEPGVYKQREFPSLHEARSLSARLYAQQGVDVQTLLGHSHSEMTDIYINDRGLSAQEFKYVAMHKKEVGGHQVQPTNHTRRK